MAPGAMTLALILRAAELLGQVAREHLDGALHRRVRRRAGDGHAGQSARDVQDAAAVGDERQQALGQQEGGLEVHPVDLVELVGRGLGDAGVQADAGVVDQVVQLLALPGARELAGNRPDEGPERRAVGDVERDGDGLPSEGPDLLAHLASLGGGGAVREDDVDAALGEAQGHVARPGRGCRR